MCNARQINDQMVCGPCGLQWDVKDPEPPKCRGLNGGRSQVLRQVRNADNGKGAPIFNAADLARSVLDGEGVATFALCVEIARQAFKQGQDSIK